MKLAKIGHIRCNEWSGSVTYIWIPDEWDQETFDAKVLEAEKAYQKYIDEFSKIKEPPQSPNYNLYGHITQSGVPDDMTIGELKASMAEREAKRNEWTKKREKTNRGFLAFCEDVGMVAFYDFEKAGIDTLESEADWGHQHGVPIKYDETEVPYNIKFKIEKTG